MDKNEKILEMDTYPNFGKGKTSTERTSVLERDVDSFQVVEKLDVSCRVCVETAKTKMCYTADTTP